DVQVLSDQSGPATSLAEITSKSDLAPTSELAWYLDVGSRSFSWRWAEDQSELPIGELQLCGPGEGFSRVEGGFLLDGKQVSFDELVLRSMKVAFIEERGAASETAIRRLVDASVSRFCSGAKISERLSALGLEEKCAQVLVELLGLDARLLLHRTQLPEGVRREALLNEVSEVDEGEVDLFLVSQLNSGTRVEKREASLALEGHLEFLRRDGAGGFWVESVKRGLPEFSYQKAERPSGQADFRFENLSELSFSGALLAGASFCGARVDRGKLAKVDLRGSCCAYASFQGAKFPGADLSGCDFRQAQLAGADFRGANLADTNFERADLTGANFAGALTSRTMFGGANVRGIKY